MEFNILNGFHSESFGNEGKPQVFQPERQAAAVEIVRRVNPDILVLCEANFGWPTTISPVVVDYQKVFGYEYYFLGRSGERSGTAILSRFPFQGEDYSMFQRPHVRGHFLAGRLTLDVVHPHPSLLDIEKEKLFRSVTRDRRDPYILCGDFNALSPQDRYDRAQLVKGFARITDKPEAAVDNMLNSEAVKHLLDAGLVDTFVRCGKSWEHTVPTDLRSPHKDTAIRMDYILFAGRKVLDAGVVLGKNVEMASDHRPVYAVLEI